MVDLPRDVNGYTLKEHLGSGGFTIAYRAEKDGREYCVRQLKLGQTNGSDDAWKTWDLFKREADVLGRLDHHRIPKVYEYFTEEGGQNGSSVLSAYMAQSLIPGQNLRDKLSSEGSFTEEQIIDLGLQLCDILGYTHGQNPAVIHRDIKPSNIHQDQNGEVYLLDFGALQQEISRTCGGSTTFGTLGYAPLELAMGRAVTQSDLYMLGATFLHLLSNTHPETMLDCNESGLPHLDYRTHYQFQNPSLELVVKQLTQPLSQDRIQTAEQLADYLRQIRDGKSLKFNGRKQAGWFSRTFARFVSRGVLEYLVQTRSDIVEQAQQDRVLVAGGEPASRRISVAQTTDLPDDVDYEIMTTANNYPIGVAELNRVCSSEHNPVHPTHRKQDGTIIYRPFKFKENIRARKRVYESHAQDDPNRLRLFNSFLDSCCGAAYKKKSTKLKLNTSCRELIEIDSNFRGRFLPVEYDSLNATDGWVELDSSQRDFKERAWLVSLDEDTGLYQAYRQIVLAEKPNASMNFYTRQNTDEDELRAVYVSNLSDDSVAIGLSILSSSACFLRVAPANRRVAP